jgi:hypothetical protein
LLVLFLFEGDRVGDENENEAIFNAPFISFRFVFPEYPEYMRCHFLPYLLGPQ